MLTIYPNINPYRNYSASKNNKQIKNSVTQDNPTNITKPGLSNPLNNVSFKGWAFTHKSRRLGNKIANLIKSDAVQNIYAFVHKDPDADAIGAMLAMGREIYQATGKKVNMLIARPLPENFRFIDPDCEIKVVSEILGADASAEKIIGQFGKPDLVIGVDTPELKRFDDVFQGFFGQKDIPSCKIDHHPSSNNCSYNYAGINLVDDARKSASQIVMQFTKALGLDPKNIDRKITDPLAMGLVGDTGDFKYYKPGIFKDAELLAKTSSFEKIMTALHRVNADDFKIINQMVNSAQISEDGRIAFFIVDEANAKKPLKTLTTMALDRLPEIQGVQYYFAITKNSARPDAEIQASVRSIGKPIRAKIEELGGGGSDFACGCRKTGITAEGMRDIIISKLNELN